MVVELHAILLPALVSAYLVGLSKGGLPVVGMLSVPILAFWVNPLTAAALILPIYLVSDLYGIRIYRHAYSSRNLAILFPAGLFGILLGYLAAPYLSVAAMNISVGAIGIFYCLRTWFFSSHNPPIPPSRACKHALPGSGWFRIRQHLRNAVTTNPKVPSNLSSA